MHSEYGYMEEGALGKAYNLRLLRRLAHYAAPYKKFISTAVFLTILITALNLTLPYLSKIAIDRYILSSWYLVDLAVMEKTIVQKFIKKYGHILEMSPDGSHGLIAHMDIKSMDPSELHEHRSKGVISEKRFYKVGIDAQNHSIFRNQGIETLTMADGSILVPLRNLNNLKPEEIRKVREQDIRGVAMVGIVLFVFLFTSFGLGYVEHYILELTGQKIMQDIRLQLFQRIQSQSVSFFDRHPVGRLVTRVTNDVGNLNEMFKSVVVAVFKDIFILTSILVVLLYLNWRLALICFTLIPIIFGITLLFSYLAREAFRELRAKVAMINTFLEECITGMPVIQLFTREAFQMARFTRINHENYLAGMKQIRVFAVFMPLMEALASLIVALLIWHGGGKVISEQLTLGSLVAFIGYIRMFFRPLQDISEKYNIMQSAMASTERILEFMDHKEEIPEPVNPIRSTQVKGHLQFKDVSFAYKDDHYILHNVSFEVKPGEMVAMVGATGGGKTTVVNLIERFYDPDKGQVLLDGIDLKDWSKNELRSHIGFVMQDVFIFSGSLIDNISLGQDEISVEAIQKAVREANAHRFIRRLPDGFQQEMGERGSTLSGGERQLLSLARALAYNPKVLILDEATASVDPETERLIQEAIFKMAKRCTTFVVAHRLSTIRKADRILVMHHGQIREHGTHEELMSLRGIYYKLNKFREVEKY
ncbi:MAG: ABC transporter ATP-binding protein [Candidatus Desulfatibia sp.]|uniref:ABC transporter ATP-binding protein n=1 Tax=Candidatus Desulfatibia sp. TaxID=3101189 RepID=UPI002F34C9C2